MHRTYRHMLNPFQNQDGSAIVLALIMLAILTIIGISSSTTSTIELQIVRNEKIHQLNFYQAEAAIHEAVQRLELLDGVADYSDLMPETTTQPWLNPGAADMSDPAKWDSDGKDDPSSPGGKDNAALSLAGNSRYAVEYRGKEPGSSLKTGEISVNLYTVYGLAQENGGEVIMDIGSKKPVLNP